MFNKYLWIFILVMVNCNGASASLVFTAPPRESAAEGTEYYGPIADFISKAIGQKVVYEHPENWTSYSRNMRAGKYDIVFDGPHFAAWRIVHTNHFPLVRLSGTLEFVIMAKSTDAGTNSMIDLLGKSLCGLPSPQLGTLAAFSLYKNPVNQPEIMIIKGGMPNVLKTFLTTNKCTGAVVPKKMYNALPQEKKKQIKVIAYSRVMPNQTFTVGERISASDREKIATALTSPQGALAADKLLTVYTPKGKFLVPAKLEEFTDLELLLEGVVFGW